MAMASTAAGARRWVAWAVGIASAAVGLVVVAWVTGAFAEAPDQPGACYRYDELASAAGAPEVPCDEPHTGQAVAFLAPSLDPDAVPRQCRSAVQAWLDMDARGSRARVAYQHHVVAVQAPWRRSGFRCDVVRVAYPGPGTRWEPGVVTGSSQGAVAEDPASWAQCRRAVGARSGASVGCRASGKRVVEFAFTVRTKGPHRPDTAARAAEQACREAAAGEVRAGARPVLVSEVDESAWESGKRAEGRCTFTTKVWTLARS